MSSAQSAASGPLSVDDVTVTPVRTVRTAIGASALGNVTEWYDFGVFSYMVVVVNSVFFPDSMPVGFRIIATFGLQAASFVIRPLGGLFFGPLGDRLGRTKVLSITVIMMAVGTVIIGLVPPYSMIGLAAPMLVLLARFIQGFSTGGEYGGAMTFIAEYAPDRRRGFFGSWLEFGTLTGYAMGATFSLVLTSALGHDALYSWGWRLPFLLALPIGLIGLYLRLRLEETPAFSRMVQERPEHTGTPTREEFRLIFVHYWPTLLLVGGLVAAWNVTNYMLTAFMPTYLGADYLGKAGKGIGDTLSQVFQIVVLLILMVIITFIGRLSDRVGRRVILGIGCGMLVVLSLPAILLIQAGNDAATFGGLLIMGLTLVCFSSICPSTLPAMFPTKIRYGGLSIAFNIFVSAFGGTTAVVTSSLIQLTGDLRWPAYYLILFGVVGAVCVWRMRESARRPLAGSNHSVSTEQEARELVAQSR